MGQDRRTEVAAVVDRVRLLLSRGEFLGAYDEASSALATHPDQPLLRYLAVVALVRSGAMRTAEAHMQSLLSEIERTSEDQLTTVLVEVAELRAAIARERVQAVSGADRIAAARAAAIEYESVFARSRVFSSCVNAATLWLLAGDRVRSRSRAVQAIELIRSTPPRSTIDAYRLSVSEAEALLLLGESNRAFACLQRAEREAPGDYGARATTRSELRIVCDVAGIDHAVLTSLHIPRVIHYCGHRISRPGDAGRFPAAAEEGVRAEVRQVLEERTIGFGFGSLASGADIIIAECLLDRDAELHIVLPFEANEFVAASVADSGPGWVRRFERCLAAATSTTVAAENCYLGEPILFAHCGNVAMGEAILRAKGLTTEVEQLAVWDGRPAINEAGTAVDVEMWSSRGHSCTVIDSRSSLDTEHTVEVNRSHGQRSVRAMLFADVAGYSMLSDEHIPSFLDTVMTPLGTTLDKYASSVDYINTWGDAIFAVLSSVEAAADCALALQTTMQSLEREGRPHLANIGLRIGVHAGPVFVRNDPIRGDTNFYGEAVARAARVEPRTPVGEVYVTHAFAALLALGARPDLRCEYVGRLPAAKSYGTFPMFLLTQSTS